MHRAPWEEHGRPEVKVPKLDPYDGRGVRYRISVPIPPFYSAASCWTPSGRLKTYREEDGTVWLWFDPGLLLWERKLTWLFSPVTGNRLCPGDLWGVDEAGELVIVETKRVGATVSGRRPFEDFLAPADDPYHLGERGAFGVVFLRGRWEGLLADELKRPSALHLDSEGVGRGVLPYSRHRLAIARWWPTIAERLTDLVRSDGYLGDVDACLEARRAAGEPPPHYVGVFTVTGDTQPYLSRRGATEADVLRAAVGPDRVHLRAVWAERTGEGTLDLRAEDVGFEPGRRR